MCTAGFLKDKKGIIHYFKNVNLSPKNIPFKTEVENKKSILIKRFKENGECYHIEGMNKYGVINLGLSLKTDEKIKNPKPRSINFDLSKAKTAKKALNILLKQNKKYDFNFTKIIGDTKNIFVVEVSPCQIAVVDLSNAPFFACTNHGQMLLNAGRYKDEDTHLRLKEAQNILKKSNKKDDLKDLLSSHLNGKNKSAICNHSKNIQTYGAYIFTPYDLTADICLAGKPCEKGFKKYKIT